jgi:trehalose 6-phosphate phosphatase
VRDILADSNRPLLARVAGSHALLAFDYDGTLAPIVSDPGRAEMRPATRELLEAVSSAYPCVVISGRAQKDVASRIHETGLFDVMGNHGIETEEHLTVPAPPVGAWIASLERGLAGRPGVIIEDKSFSVAVHYRHAPDRRDALAAILRAAAALPGVRAVPGKCVVNLTARGAPHKGTALAGARERFRCDVALYVGDDEADEDVFGLEAPDWLLTIRVRPRRGSKAAFYVQDQKSIDLLLARLLQLRRASWTSGPAVIAPAAVPRPPSL